MLAVHNSADALTSALRAASRAFLRLTNLSSSAALAASSASNLALNAAAFSCSCLSSASSAASTAGFFGTAASFSFLASMKSSFSYSSFSILAKFFLYSLRSGFFFFSASNPLVRSGSYSLGSTMLASLSLTLTRSFSSLAYFSTTSASDFWRSLTFSDVSLAGSAVS